MATRLDITYMAVPDSRGKFRGRLVLMVQTDTAEEQKWIDFDALFDSRSAAEEDAKTRLAEAVLRAVPGQ